MFGWLFAKEASTPANGKRFVSISIVTTGLCARVMANHHCV
ncbi:Frd3 [Salmonella phage 21]|nr:Frd3 [Salmonella phage 21]